MRDFSTQQFATLAKHLEGDYSTLNISLDGGHRVTLIGLDESSSDSLIVGQDLAGNRVELDPLEVCMITYVKANARVMTESEIQSYKAGNVTTPALDGPVKLRRRARKPPRQPDGE